MVFQTQETAEKEKKSQCRGWAPDTQDSHLTYTVVRRDIAQCLTGHRGWGSPWDFDENCRGASYVENSWFKM